MLHPQPVNDSNNHMSQQQEMCEPKFLGVHYTTRSYLFIIGIVRLGTCFTCFHFFSIGISHKIFTMSGKQSEL